MYYNVTTYGKRNTTYYWGNYDKVRKYLLKKKKEGFVTLRNVEGKQSEMALALNHGQLNIVIEYPDETA